jgi:DnaJ-class molecular chaperone
MEKRTNTPTAGQPPMSPGDEAPPGTPGTGETVCGRCGGSGLVGTARCPDCEGTGKVTRGVGGA